MSIRNDIIIDWNVSPRLIKLLKGGANDDNISLQDLTDTLRSLEAQPESMSYPFIVNSSGKEELGGGVLVGITSTLQNAKLAFESRVVSKESGAVTTADSDGEILIDNTALFVTNEVAAGALVINLDDESAGTVITIDSEIQLTIQPLENGILNEFTIGDRYKVWNIIQCEISGGNLVAVDDVGDTTSPVSPTAFTQIVKTSSSSATLQELEALQYASFQNGVWIKISGSQTGIEYPSGTRENPVNNILDAVSIANNRGFDTLFILESMTLDSGTNVDNFKVVGSNASQTVITVDSSLDCENVVFNTCTIQGTLDGGSLIERCDISDINYVNGEIRNSVLCGTIVLGGGALANIIDCRSGIVGTNTPTIDMGGSGNSLGLRDYHGGIKITNKTGTDKISIDMSSGQVKFAADVTAGEIVCRGVGKITEDLSSGATIINQMLNPESISDQVWEESASNHLTPGSYGCSFSQIPKDLTITYYVSPDGNDSNDGRSPCTPFLTVNKALTTVPKGGTIRIGKGLYIEVGLTLSKDFVSIISEYGVTLVSPDGWVLTISGSGNYINQLAVLNVGGNGGCLISGNNNFLDVCDAQQCLDGYLVTGDYNYLRSTRSLIHSGSGYNITGKYNVFLLCFSANSTGESIGFNISANSADHNIISECSSIDNKLSAFVALGASRNTFINFTYSVAELPPEDNGIYTTWVGGSFAGNIWDTPLEHFDEPGTFGGEVATKADLAASTSTSQETINSGTIIYGSETGTYTNTFVRDNIYWQITEDLTNGLTVEMEFDVPGVDHRPGQFSIFGRYEGSPANSHFLNLYVYNYENDTWEISVENFMPGGVTTDENHSYQFYERHIDRINSKVKFRLVHNPDAVYNDSHNLYMDYVEASFIEVITADKIADAVWDHLSGEVVKKMIYNKVIKEGDIVTIYEDDKVTVWKQFDLSGDGRVEL